MRRKRTACQRPRRAGIVLSWLSALGISVALIAVINPPRIWVEGAFTIHFLDVGQGDSAFLVFPRGKTMLVDGGGELRFGRPERNQTAGESEDESVFVDRGFSIGESVVSRFIWSLGRTRIDYLVATHAHADHIGGLSDVAANFRVGQAIVGHAPTTDPEYLHFANTLRQRGISLFAVEAGERFDIDGVTIEVLWPPRSQNAPVTSGNNDSIVLRFVYGSVSILLAGDIEQAAEESLVSSGLDLRADLLKVPHHGSRTSSTEAFLNSVMPGYAVFSVGERSRFGHPHAAVVSRYLAHGVKQFRTGRDGTVTVQTDGYNLDLRTFRSKQ